MNLFPFYPKQAYTHIQMKLIHLWTFYIDSQSNCHIPHEFCCFVCLTDETRAVLFLDTQMHVKLSVQNFTELPLDRTTQALSYVCVCRVR